MSFIESINAESLNMSSTDFERYMTGEAVPPGAGNEHLCLGLRLMYENLRVLGELRERQEKAMAEALQIQADMNEFKESFIERVDRIKARTPLTIRPRKVKVDLDAEFSGNASNLPSPLVPVRIPLDDASVSTAGQLQEKLNEQQLIQENKNAEEFSKAFLEDTKNVNISGEFLSCQSDSLMDSKNEIEDILLGEESLSIDESSEMSFDKFEGQQDSEFVSDIGSGDTWVVGGSADPEVVAPVDQELSEGSAVTSSEISINERTK